MHGNEKHICPQCHRAFARRDNLQKHLRTRCHPQIGHSELQTQSIAPLAEDDQETRFDSPLLITQADELVMTPQPYQVTSTQSDPEPNVSSRDETVDFTIPSEPPIEVVMEVFGDPPGPLKFDFLGRVDCLGLGVLFPEVCV
jgi:hypothetical protein